MKVSILLIGFVISAFMLTGMIGFYSDLFNNYSVPNTAGITINDTAQNLTGQVEDMQTTFKDPDNLGDVIGLIVTGGYAAVTTLFSFPELIANSVTTVMTGVPFSLPSFIGDIINAVIWIIFVFAFIHIVFKVKPEA